MAKNKFILMLFYYCWCIFFYSCQSDNCIDTLNWVNTGMKSTYLKPKLVRVANKNYCGYDFSLKQWSPMPTVGRFDDDFLKGEIFQIGDTIFLKSSIGIISPFIFWNTSISDEYSVKTTVISRYMEDNFKQGYSRDFDFTFSRDTLLYLGKTDTIQRIRMKNFNRYHDASLVLVISKKRGIEGVYISTGKAEKDGHEVIFALEGNIYIETIPSALMFDPKRMSIE